MKRCKIELLSLGFAAAILALFADRAPVSPASNSRELSSREAMAESTHYLEGTPSASRYHRSVTRWSVTDGESTAWLDARTGELVEVEFAAPR